MLSLNNSIMYINDRIFASINICKYSVFSKPNYKLYYRVSGPYYASVLFVNSQTRLLQLNFAYDCLSGLIFTPSALVHSA